MLDAMLALLLLPWWGMLLFALLILVDVCWLEAEEEGWGTSCLLIGTWLLFYFGADVNILVSAWNNLGSAVAFALGYFFVGGTWSLAKWYLYLLQVRKEFRLEVGKYEAMVRSHGENATSYSLGRRPSRPGSSFAWHNKSRIMAWIGHWPISMLQTFIGDVVLRAVKNVYKALSGVYDSIANKLFAEFEQK